MTIRNVSQWEIEMYAYTKYTPVLMEAEIIFNWRNVGFTKEANLELGCGFVCLFVF